LIWSTLKEVEHNQYNMSVVVKEQFLFPTIF